MMLMQLRDAGKLLLDDRLDQYLPEIKKTTHLPITLRQLASHTSGLPLMPPMEELSRVMQEFPPSIETLKKVTFPSIGTILAALPSVELLSSPGTQVSYSNLGFALLAHAMERITGHAYENYIEQYILHPLGMNHSGFSTTIRDSTERAVCYLPFSSPAQIAPFETKLIAGFSPTGALWSSCNDMSHFLAFLTNPQRLDPSSPLSSGSFEEMYQIIAPLKASRYTEIVTDAGVGIGWFLSRVQAHLVAEHGGADPSTAAYVAWVPKTHLAAFIATNTGKNPTGIATTAVALLEQTISHLNNETGKP
jgi:CubicO group peptidase (beta-lactamase class C family)